MAVGTFARGAVVSDKDLAILGTGMHPWGKWGHNFVEYGVVAAQNALADAGVEWKDIQFVSGADTMRNASTPVRTVRSTGQVWVSTPRRCTWLRRSQRGCRTSRGHLPTPGSRSTMGVNPPPRGRVAHRRPQPNAAGVRT